MQVHDPSAHPSSPADARRRERRFPIICTVAVALFMIVIGSIAFFFGVPPLAIFLAAITAGGITAWSIATDPVLRQFNESSRTTS